MRSLTLCILLFAFSIASAQDWKQLAGPTRSRARQVEVDRSGSIYALTDSNEIYRSDDHGKNWIKFRVPNSINSKQYTYLYCSKSGTIFLSVSVSSYSGTQYDSSTAGLYRSTDKGTTWAQVRSKKTPTKIVEFGQKNIYASNEWDYSLQSVEVFKSEDDGITWKSFKNISLQFSKFDADDQGRLYVQANNSSQIYVYASDGGYLTQLNDSTILKGNYYNVQGTLKYIGSNRFAFLSDTEFYVKFGDGDWVLRSKQISKWPYENNKQILQYNGDNLLLTISNSYGNKKGYYMSSDLGASWKFIGMLDYIYDANMFLCIDSSYKVIYSDAQGICRSAIGDTTRETIGFPIATVSSLVVDKNGDIHAADSAYYSGSSQINRLSISKDFGVSWTVEEKQYYVPGNIGLSPDSGVFCIVDSLYYTSPVDRRYLFHYDPTSREWEKRTTFEDRVYPQEFKFFPPSTLYIDQSRSDDNGSTWDGLYTYPSVSFVYSHSYTVAAPGKVIIGYRPAIYMTEDNGVTWQKLYHNLIDRNITAVYGDQEGLIIAGSEYGDIIRSNENGTSWTNWTGSLQGSIQKITSTVDKTVYVATTKGLYSRGLNDADWKVEIPDKQIVAIGFGKDNEVFACVSQEGIWTNWKKHFPKLQNGVAKKGIRGISVSPTPATNYITAGFDLDQSGDVSVSLFDELGREVTSKQELLGEGWHQLRLETSSVPSGIYHVQLITPSGKVMSKVLVTH